MVTSQDRRGIIRDPVGRRESRASLWPVLSSFLCVLYEYVAAPRSAPDQVQCTSRGDLGEGDTRRPEAALIGCRHVYIQVTRWCPTVEGLRLMTVVGQYPRHSVLLRIGHQSPTCNYDLVC